MPINRLKDERDCLRLRHEVMGCLNVLELLAANLANPNEVMDVGMFTWQVWRDYRDRFASFTADPVKMGRFRSLFRDFANVADVAQGLVGALDRIEAHRDQALKKHLGADGQIVRIFKHSNPHMLRSEVAAMNGLTPEEFDAVDQQTTEGGVMLLGQTEREAYRNAILAELED
jgi:hypothetical protein